MNIHHVKALFPNGRTKALTMSYDDGVIQDRRLVDIFNRNGIKGTFNINSGSLLCRNNIHIEASEVKSLYKNHEVAAHSYTHPHLSVLPKEMILFEVLEDKKNLEELVEYPVRGMAYPGGAYSSEVIDALKAAGIVYSRTAEENYSFGLPENYMEWVGTCHHNYARLFELGKDFLEKDIIGVGNTCDLSLFYVWGHSYEFDNNWELIEDFCQYIGGNDKVWYATNIEIIDYMDAYKRLVFAATGSSIYNPSAVDVWVEIDGKKIMIEKGKVYSLRNDFKFF